MADGGQKRVNRNHEVENESQYRYPLGMAGPLPHLPVAHDPAPDRLAEVARNAASAVPLTSLMQGQTGVICEARLDVDDAALLRAMGLGDRVRVKLCRVGEPCVVALGTTAGRHCHCQGHCRIGLARGLADRIFVRVVA